MRLIGITGLKGSGKSTAAARLVERHRFLRLRMAGALKDMLRVLGLSPEEIDGALKEQPCELLGGNTPRFAMQTLGVEWGRQLIAEDLWLRVMRRKLQQTSAAFVVIDDIRFPNEVELVKEFGGVMWRIERPGLQSDGHASEREIAALTVDRTIYNHGSLEDLIAVVDAVWGYLNTSSAVGSSSHPQNAPLDSSRP